MAKVKVDIAAVYLTCPCGHGLENPYEGSLMFMPSEMSIGTIYSCPECGRRLELPQWFRKKCYAESLSR